MSAETSHPEILARALLEEMELVYHFPDTIFYLTIYIQLFNSGMMNKLVTRSKLIQQEFLCCP